MKLHLRIEEFYAVFLGLTALVYFYTLYKVYRPLTKLRACVILAMIACMMAIYFLVPQVASVGFDKHSVNVLVPGIILVPAGIECCGFALGFVERYFMRKEK